MVKLIYLISVIGILLTAAYANDGFILNSLEQTNKLSQEINKPALIIFGSDDCKFCNLLKQDIINYKLSPDIDKYIICYIDIKKNPELKNEYDVSVIPDSRILINGKETNRIKGYSKTNYMKWLNIK